MIGLMVLKWRTFTTGPPRPVPGARDAERVVRADAFLAASGQRAHARAGHPLLLPLGLAAAGPPHPSPGGVLQRGGPKRRRSR
eukprot:5805370-Pyramimonas_sp.AAC.1